MPLPGRRSFNAHFQYSPLFSAVLGVSESRASWFDLPTIFHCRGGSHLGVEVLGGVSPSLKQRHSQDHLLFSVPPLISIFRDTPVGVLQQRIHLLLLILLTSLLSLNFSLLNSSKSVTTNFFTDSKIFLASVLCSCLLSSSLCPCGCLRFLL